MSALQLVGAVPVPTLAELAADYFAHYAGRDTSRVHRLAWWVERLGDRSADSITDDDVFMGLEALAKEPSRRYAGRDADGEKVFRAMAKRSPATLNRYHVALAALYSWAIKRRRLPRSVENPCKRIAKNRETAGVVRFLSEEERERLLAACRAAAWPRLYLLVLLAITTGARRSELLGLRWRDIDLGPSRFAGWTPTATIATTKNNDPKLLPLVPAVVQELQRFAGAPSALVFPSRRKPSLPYGFGVQWKEACRAANVRRFRFHDLRHTCASYLAQRGASLLEIADVLGHRQLAMSARYSHLTVGTKANLVNRVLGGIK
jgi:integrase